MGKTPKVDNRFREQFKFWLDTKNASDFELADYITELKAEHRFSKTLRDGLRLVKDLRSGSLKELFDQFPDLRKDFINRG